ncbi:MAG: 3-hydroxyacyl-[acyl-carrier-protein] dehydratase [Gammaproteobacteria bacterium]|jgi:3-hydroxyacyl-[acyl-carrier-protein] dehydratase
MDEQPMEPLMDIHEVLKFLPHRYPFVMLDRVLECTPGERLVALKNVTYNEHFFPGHFPREAVMPAVLILESMAQATGILAMKTLGGVPSDDSVYYFVGIDSARFRHPVTPGDQLLVEVEHQRRTRGIWRVGATARVDGKVVANATLMGALREVER